MSRFDSSPGKGVPNISAGDFGKGDPSAGGDDLTPIIINPSTSVLPGGILTTFQLGVNEALSPIITVGDGPDSGTARPTVVDTTGSEISGNPLGKVDVNLPVRDDTATPIADSRTPTVTRAADFTSEVSQGANQITRGSGEDSTEKNPKQILSGGLNVSSTDDTGTRGNQIGSVFPPAERVNPRSRVEFLGGFDDTTDIETQALLSPVQIKVGFGPDSRPIDDVVPDIDDRPDVDGEKPPEPADGERPPEPADGERPPEPADGERPPEPADGEEPPAADGEQPPEVFEPLIISTAITASNASPFQVAQFLPGQARTITSFANPNFGSPRKREIDAVETSGLEPPEIFPAVIGSLNLDDFSTDAKVPDSSGPTLPSQTNDGDLLPGITAGAELAPPNTLARDQPLDVNYLYQTFFRLNIPLFPQLNYFCQRVTLPGFGSASAIERPNRFANLKIPETRVSFDNLEVTFLVDKNLSNWREVQEWMKRIYLVKDHTDILPNSKDHSSTANLFFLNSAMNANLQVMFKNIFPVSLSGLDFDSSVTDLTPFTATATFAYDTYEFVAPEIGSSM